MRMSDEQEAQQIYAQPFVVTKRSAIKAANYKPQCHYSTVNNPTWQLEIATGDPVVRRRPQWILATH